MLYALPPYTPDAPTMPNGFVKPVRATPARFLSIEPACVSVFRFHGCNPFVNDALLPVDTAHTYGPAPVFCNAVSATDNFAVIIEAFTPELRGFHTPAIGVQDAVSVAVVNVAALIAVNDIPPEKMLPR